MNPVDGNATDAEVLRGLPSLTKPSYKEFSHVYE